MARLFADENFPLPVVLELRQLGHDVWTIQEAGKANQAMDDEAVLAFAHADGRAVLTINRKHFVRLHNAGLEHSGIIACTFDPVFQRQAHRIHAAMETHKLAGQLIRVNRPNA
jgi:phage-related tail fiber protein